MNLTLITIIPVTVGKKPLRRDGIALIVNKSPKCSTRMQSQKQQNDLCSFPRQTIQYHSGGDGGGLVAKSCLTLVNSLDCSLLGSSVHEILQARILEWVAISFSRGFS